MYSKMYSFSVCLVAVIVASCYGQEAPLPEEVAPAPISAPLQEYHAPAPIPAPAPEPTMERNPLCTLRNNYYPVQTSCDSYIECREYIAHEMLCPDGLHFNPEALWPAYPCSYPTEVTCVGRGAAQPPIPTQDCPHQYGFYPSPAATEHECGMYRMCVAGQAIEMMCPPKLAFNAETARCDWPDLVPSCDARAFLGFECPAVPASKDGEVPVINYRYEGSCYAFYSCEGSRARLLSCDVGFAFDAALGKCVDSEKVVCEESRAL